MPDLSQALHRAHQYNTDIERGYKALVVHNETSYYGILSYVKSNSIRVILVTYYSLKKLSNMTGIYNYCVVIEQVHKLTYDNPIGTESY